MVFVEREGEYESDSVRDGASSGIEEEESDPQGHVDNIPLAQTEEAASQPSTPARRDRSSSEETRSRFNANADTQLLSKVLAKPLFGVTRGKLKGVWEGITSRLKSELNTSFTARACRDRTSHLLR
ncbi:hypothetical protein DVH05_024092 [Phytophthora capsici]|nr:hypothetical protein DVH05_019347 [Phytophthora capsici]KAG1683018.1 hypothetical protein DVH05_018045 [Phytophthora capsici]KAG1693058.1 hypothetical protein DVH05_024092 [Phytophthora capsici]